MRILFCYTSTVLLLVGLGMSPGGLPWGDFLWIPRLSIPKRAGWVQPPHTKRPPGVCWRSFFVLVSLRGRGSSPLAHYCVNPHTHFHDGYAAFATGCRKSGTFHRAHKSTTLW